MLPKYPKERNETGLVKNKMPWSETRWWLKVYCDLCDLIYCDLCNLDTYICIGIMTRWIAFGDLC